MGCCNDTGQAVLLCAFHPGYLRAAASGRPGQNSNALSAQPDHCCADKRTVSCRAVESAAGSRRDSDGADDRHKGEDLKEIHKLLRIAWDKYQDDDRYVNVSSAGQYIKRAKPDFDARTYGYVKLPDLIEAFPKRYAMKRYPGKGTVTIIAYKCI